MGLPDDLPVRALERPLVRALSAGPVVVTSPTGSGKSTWIPLVASELLGRVLVVEPRRVACRSLARYLAACLGSEPGQQVGYAVRHEDRLGQETRVAFVTPGVALRMLEQGLPEQRCVLLDEFHQRGLETDLLLAVLLARGHRRLGILSATLDGQRVARHVGGELLEASGRQHPVEVRYLGQDPVPGGRQLERRVLEALDGLRQASGDVLVFLPGKAEIAACQAALAGHPVFEALPLHAQLTPEQQDAPFRPAERRRAILSTNVAETSVTLPWVRSVVDSGLVRRTIYREGRGALALTPVALDAADQRAGRAGRLGPGLCLRLWGRAGKLEPRTPPEILREDLSQLVLQVTNLGHRVQDLPWLDPPRDYAVEDARGLLRGLGALDGQSRITPVGRQVGQLPLDPVLGRLLLAAGELEALPEMLQLVAALSLGGPLFARGEPLPPQSGEPDPLTEARCDATALVLALRRPRLARGRVRHEALAEARRVAEQLAALMGVRLPTPEAPVRRLPLAEAVLRALPGSPFARRGRRDAWGNGRVELVLGRESLVEPEARTVLVVDQRLLAERGRKLRRIATCCMPVSPDWLQRRGAGKLRALSARVKDGVLLARLSWSIGTTVLQTTEQLPRGEAAREALLKLLLEGRLLGPAVAAARDELEAHELRLALGGGRRAGRVPGGFEGWLRRRLEQLGFESGEDLPLLSARDLEPGLLTAEQRAEVDRDFPRSLNIGGLKLRAAYDPGALRVTLHAGRAGAPPPRPDFLPRWPGWSVAYHDGKHTVMLRSPR